MQLHMPRIAEFFATAVALIAIAVPMAHAQATTAQSPASPAHAQLMASISSNGNKPYFRSVVVLFLKNVVERNDADVTNPADIWTPADIEASADLFLPPVIDALDQRVLLYFASQIPTADAERLNLALGTEASLKAMNCGFTTPAADRTPAVWAACERSNAVTFSAADRQALGKAHAVYADSLGQPVINGALGGTICHALARYAQHLSKDGTQYKLGTSFAMNGVEQPKSCEVHKARWAALAGFDALLRLEPQIAFEKKDD